MADSAASATSASGRVAVYVRVRPTVASESGSAIAVARGKEASSNVVVTHKEQDPREFHFDRVLWQDDTQDSVYDVVGKPILDSVLTGYNGTIFAYGQTGSGKTYTLINMGDLSSSGLFPRTSYSMFACVA